MVLNEKKICVLDYLCEENFSDVFDYIKSYIYYNKDNIHSDLISEFKLFVFFNKKTQKFAVGGLDKDLKNKIEYVFDFTKFIDMDKVPFDIVKKNMDIDEPNIDPYTLLKNKTKIQKMFFDLFDKKIRPYTFSEVYINIIYTLIEDNFDEKFSLFKKELYKSFCSKFKKMDLIEKKILIGESADKEKVCDLIIKNKIEPDNLDSSYFIKTIFSYIERSNKSNYDKRLVEVVNLIENYITPSELYTNLTTNDDVAILFYYDKKIISFFSTEYINQLISEFYKNVFLVKDTDYIYRDIFVEICKRNTNYNEYSLYLKKLSDDDLNEQRVAFSVEKDSYILIYFTSLIYKELESRKKTS